MLRRRRHRRLTLEDLRGSGTRRCDEAAAVHRHRRLVTGRRSTDRADLRGAAVARARAAGALLMQTRAPGLRDRFRRAGARGARELLGRGGAAGRCALDGRRRRQRSVRRGRRRLRAEAAPSSRVPREFLELARTASLHRDRSAGRCSTACCGALHARARACSTIALRPPTSRRARGLRKASRATPTRCRPSSASAQSAMAPASAELRRVVRAGASHRRDGRAVLRPTASRNMRFSILTPDGAVHWDANAWRFDHRLARRHAAHGGRARGLWRTYYSHLQPGAAEGGRCRRDAEEATGGTCRRRAHSRPDPQAPRTASHHASTTQRREPRAPRSRADQQPGPHAGHGRACAQLDAPPPTAAGAALYGARNAGGLRRGAGARADHARGRAAGRPGGPGGPVRSSVRPASARRAWPRPASTARRSTSPMR